MQERITTIPYPISSFSEHGTTAVKFKFYLCLNLSQSIIACVASWLYLVGTGIGVRIAGLSNDSANHDAGESLSIKTRLLLDSLQVSLMQVIAPQFGYASLKHIDYPTMILGKSCKLVPVMLANVLLHRRSFAAYKYVAVGLITAGVSGFMLLHEDDDHNSKQKVGLSLYGLGLLLANLLVDGATNATQETMFKKYHMQGPQMMFFMNIGLSFIVSLYLLVNPYTTELSSAISMISQNHTIAYDILVFGICGSLGQLFIFHTLQRFGSVRLVTVTVTRKMLTILWSVFRFGHHLSVGQWAAVGVVFGGILVDAYAPRLTRGDGIVHARTHEYVEATMDGMRASHGHDHQGHSHSKGHHIGNGHSNGLVLSDTPVRASQRLRNRQVGMT